MSDTILRDLVLKRLDADTKPEHEWSALVLAALEGPEELASLLEGQSVVSFRGAAGRVGGASESAGVGPSAPPPPPRIAFLRTITVEGFRGIGPRATLDLAPGPGLTLVVGRNGSGKSSFAEGLELLLAGDTYRWKKRSVVWRDGRGNLLHPKAALAADFALEGERGACRVRVGGRAQPQRLRERTGRPPAGPAGASSPPAGLECCHRAARRRS